MIELKNISVNAGNFSLRNISMQLEKGKFHVLLGPSGSGKTVLLETIAGLKQSSHGAIFFDGNDITHFLPEKRNLSYLPQDNALFPHKNVFDNIAFGLRLNKKFSETTIKEKIYNIADTLDITALLQRGIANLSGGEQQRVALARALVLDNNILLLDEPTSSLHETMQENFCLLLKKIQSQWKLTVLMTTHHKDSAFMLADALHFIDEGQLFFSVEKNKLSGAALPVKIAELLGISNVLKLKKKDVENNSYYCEQLQTHFTLQNIPPDLSEFFLGIKPVDVRVIKDEEKHLTHLNSFEVMVEQIILKESDALVILKSPATGYVLKTELSIYNLNKMKITVGQLLQCKIKEEHARIVF